MKDRRKHIVDDDLFDNLDSDEKAYFLGFIIADGHILRKGNSITIDLNSKDKDILYKFADLLGNKNIVKERHFKNRNPSTVLKFSSVKIKQKLDYWGIKTNKSLTIQLSPNLVNDLPSKFVSSFLRGLYDGDGGISVFNNKYNITRFNVYITGGSAEFLFTLNKVYHLNMSFYNRKDSKTCQLQYKTNFGAFLFLDYIYQNITDNKFFLSRKYNKYLNFKEHTQQIFSKSYLTRLWEAKENIEMIKDLQSKNVSVTKMSETFGYDRHILGNILKELNL